MGAKRPGRHKKLKQCWQNSCRNFARFSRKFRKHFANTRTPRKFRGNFANFSPPCRRGAPKSTQPEERRTARKRPSAPFRFGPVCPCRVTESCGRPFLVFQKVNSNMDFFCIGREAPGKRLRIFQIKDDLKNTFSLFFEKLERFRHTLALCLRFSVGPAS